MRLRHHSARGRALGDPHNDLGQYSCGGTDVFYQSWEDKLHRVNLRYRQCYLSVYPFALGRKYNQLPEVSSTKRTQLAMHNLLKVVMLHFHPEIRE